MAAVAVTDADAALVNAAPGYRRTVRVANLGPNTAYLGVTAEVTSADGFPLPVDASVALRPGEQESVYARCAEAETADLRVLTV